MEQTAQIERLETRKDLEALLPGDIVEVKGGVTGERIPYAFEGLFYDEEEISEVVSLLRPNGGINRNLRLPQNSLVIDDGCICHTNIRGHWLTKYYPGDKNYKDQRKIIEQSGI